MPQDGAAPYASARLYRINHCPLVCTVLSCSLPYGMSAAALPTAGCSSPSVQSPKGAPPYSYDQLGSSQG